MKARGPASPASLFAHGHRDVASCSVQEGTSAAMPFAQTIGAKGPSYDRSRCGGVRYVKVRTARRVRP